VRKIIGSRRDKIALVQNNKKDSTRIVRQLLLIVKMRFDLLLTFVIYKSKTSVPVKIDVNKL
jgi:hypothetical protein